MKTYQDFLEKKGEVKWQKYWEKKKLFQTPKDATPDNKFYILPQLPYPSGSGLHVGHAEVYSACDIYARYQRMRGKKVLQAIGWDSFGLPAENYAIKTNVHPKISTEKAVDNFRKQIKSLGISVDWDREVGSHNSDYYKWTQWFFLLMYKRGLAYRKKQAVNWCESCKTVLANDQVKEGKCERCDTVIIQKEMEQWYLKITDYADRLLEGLDKLDWPEETVKRQRDWIGRSEGAEVQFDVISVENEQAKRLNKRSDRTLPTLKVFTTRPDTLFGATYMVLAPEGQYVQDLKDQITNWKEVEKYIEKTSKKTELDRQMDKEKTGVELKGIKAINPATEEEIPVYIADYVLASYGTGAIMAVPAHDERDFEFAMKFGIEIKNVVIEKLGDRLSDSVERKAVRGVCVKDGKILLIFDTKIKEYLLPGGGVEEGENFEDALKREVLEELGYKNIKVTKELGQVEHNYYHWKRDNNLHSLVSGFSFEIENEEQGERTKEEIEKNKIYWFDVEEGISLINKAKIFGKEVEFVERFKAGNKCFSGGGVSVNSDFLDGLETEEATQKMIAWLEEKNIGKGKIQYKLRDWSVSRQRFWGAPIPMLQKVSDKKPKILLIHGLSGHSKENWFPRFKEQMESKGFEVIIPDLPNADKPVLKEWLDGLNKLDIKKDDRLFVIGHSLGGPTACQFVLRNKLNVEKLILVAPTGISQNNKDWSNLLNAGASQEGVDSVKNFNEENKNLEKLNDLVGQFTVYFSEDDPFIPLEVKNDYGLVRGKNKIYKDLGHFNETANLMEFPDILKEFPEDINNILKPVPESDLPVILPDDVDFKPTGESPLNYSKSFAKGVEKKYGKGWHREPDTLDTFMCSSWYFFRYLDPKNKKEFASPEQLKSWMPIDFYLGGPEHVNGHLLYSRFFTKVLFDAGYIDFDEPFTVNRHQGLILGEDGRKMSKRWDNSIDPTDVVKEYGADTCRMYEMFMGPLEDDKPWNENGIKGVRRFLDKVWTLQEKVDSKIEQSEGVDKATHKTIKKVSKDMETLGFNTAIARMMELVNLLNKEEKISITNYQLLITMLSPFAPHMAEELWSQLGNKTSICTQPWPEYDESLVKDDEITLVIQVNGKVRGDITVSADITEEDVKKQALEIENVAKWLDGKEPKKVIYVKGKLVSVVV